MQLNPNDVHVWSADLAILPEQEKELLTLLSPDECIRANRLHLSHHKQRFIAARGTLRRILCLYLNVAPQKIAFAYATHGKPFLFKPNISLIQFNVAHSHDKAVYALTLNHAIGIDIEKIQDTYNPAIAKRYFSPQENRNLQSLPEHERIVGFYRLWSRKEAIIKALGEGLSLPLSTFTVSVTDESETIDLQNKTWSLLPLSIHPDYTSALASEQTIHSLSYWHLDEDGKKIIKQSGN